MDNAKQATNLTIEGFFKDAKKELIDLNADVANLYDEIGNAPGQEAGLQRIQAAFAALNKAIGENRDSSKEVKELQEALNSVYQALPLPDLKRFSDTVDGLAENWKKAAKSADDARLSFSRAIEPDIFDPRDPRFQGPTGPLPNSAPTPSDRPSFEDVGQSVSSLTSAIDAFVQRVDKAEGRGNNPNSSASGIGQFIESTWIDLFRKYYPQQAANLSRDAILDLRNNADISYSLIRQYATENAKVLQAAGVHVDEAALQLAHFLGAGDAAKVLSAAPGTPLAGLISQKSINANPTILGGGRTVDDAISYAQRRASSEVTAKTPGDLFQGSVDSIQKRIDGLNAEYEAQAKLNPLVKDYGYAAEKARIEAELLAEAHAKGVEVTPQLAAQISTLAENYAKASSAGNQLKETNEKIVHQQQELNELGRGVLGGIIDDLRAGKDAGEIFADVLGKIADKLEEMALNALFPSNGFGGLFGGLLGGGGGGGGLLGGLLIPGILHSGGVAGVDGYGHGRSVSPSVFAGASRMHGGGVAGGLQPGEVPAILQRGEVVLPRGARGASSNDTVRVVLTDDSGRMSDIADQRIKTHSGTIVEVAVQRSTKAVRNGMPGYLAEAQSRKL